jgi:hypothetical protein
VYSSTATTIVVSIFVENNWFTKEEYGSCETNDDGGGEGFEDTMAARGL